MSETKTPRVDGCIEAAMARYPRDTKTELARYFEQVHQDLAPLARTLERENNELRAMLTELITATCSSDPQRWPRAIQTASERIAAIDAARKE